MRRVRLAIACLVAAFICALTWAGYFAADPLTLVVPPGRPRSVGHRIAAVYLSGDVGYKIAMGQQLGHRLSAAGIPVVAVNSLGFFRTKRSIAEVTELLSRAILLGTEAGNPDGVVLIGHSFGADALQAGMADLPAVLRAKVRAIILIVPTKRLYLQISPIEMLDWFDPDGETLPTLSKLDWVPLICIYGAEEDDSPCPDISGGNVRRVALPGGHALDWDDAAVYRAIKVAIDQIGPRNITKNSAPYHRL